MTTAIHAPAECCPVVAGEVCWDDGIGGSGRAVAIRMPDGAMIFTDLAGSGDIPANQIVPCPEDQPPAPWETVNGTVTRTVATGAGNVIAGAAGVTITNVGDAAGVVMGAAIAPGETISLNAYADPVANWFIRVPAITYDGTGTTLHITRQA